MPYTMRRVMFGFNGESKVAGRDAEVLEDWIGVLSRAQGSEEKQNKKGLSVWLPACAGGEVVQDSIDRCSLPYAPLSILNRKLRHCIQCSAF